MNPKLPDFYYMTDSTHTKSIKALEDLELEQRRMELLMADFQEQDKQLNEQDEE